MIDLSILIVNWNTRDLLSQCLQSLCDTADRLAQADRPVLAYGSYQVEVFVVDNASRDDSVEIVRGQFPWARLIVNERNVGFAPANNQAFQASCGRYVMLLNSDTVVHRDALKQLIDFMDAQPRCGASGARLLNADGSLQPSCHPMLTPWREFWRLIFLDQILRRGTYDMARWNVNTPRLVETIKGACMIVRRAALDQIGPLLDEQYFMYTEEVDLCYRLSRANWQLYWLPAACVTHFGEASSRQAAEAMYVQLYRSKVQFYRKFGGEQRATLYKRLVRLAYWPRVLATTIAVRFKTSLAPQLKTFQRLLNDLAAM